jgi:adenosylcobyric acid synthase
VEGTGSPAEINLRQCAIANMGFARAAGAPVCLLGDIDRGSVIVALVRTSGVIDEEGAAHIVSFAIDKSRSDPALFDDGVKAIEQRTGWPCRHVIPWLAAARALPSEGTEVLDHPLQARSAPARGLKVVAAMPSRMANFGDVDPLRRGLPVHSSDGRCRATRTWWRCSAASPPWAS